MFRASVPCQCAVLQECAFAASGGLGSAACPRPGRVSVVLPCVLPPWSWSGLTASGGPQGSGVAPPLSLVALVSWRARPCVLARCRGALGVSVVLVFAAPRLRSAGARAAGWAAWLASVDEGAAGTVDNFVDKKLQKSVGDMK